MTPRNFKLLIFAAALSYGASRCLVSEPPAKASSEFKERSQNYYAKKAARVEALKTQSSASKAPEPERLPAQATKKKTPIEAPPQAPIDASVQSPVESLAQSPSQLQSSAEPVESEAPKDSWNAGDDFLYIRCGSYLLRYQLSADRAAVGLLDRFLKEQDRKILLKSSTEGQDEAKTIKIADELLSREQTQNASSEKPSPPWRYNAFKETDQYFLVGGKPGETNCDQDTDVNSLVTTKNLEQGACRVARLEQIFTWWDHGEPECDIGSTGKIYRTTRIAQ